MRDRHTLSNATSRRRSRANGKTACRSQQPTFTSRRAGLRSVIVSNAILLTTLLALVLVFALPAHASCGLGKTPRYSDIQLIRFERKNCLGGCVNFEVELSLDGFHYRVNTGTTNEREYSSPFARKIFDRSVTTLKNHAFYLMNYDSSVLAFDTPHLILSAERCGVTTTLDWPLYEHRQDIEGLFNALSTIRDDVDWRKTANPH
jgi:hypothetical protein